MTKVKATTSAALTMRIDDIVRPVPLRRGIIENAVAFPISTFLLACVADLQLDQKCMPSEAMVTYH